MSPQRTELCSAIGKPASVRDGDLLLFRRRGLISIAGRGDHSHAAKAAWWDDDLFCLEVRECHGGRAVTLVQPGRRFPGPHRRLSNEPRGPLARIRPRRPTRFMRRLAGCGYGYFGVLAASLLHLPIVRLLAQADVCDSEPRRVRRFAARPAR